MNNFFKNIVSGAVLYAQLLIVAFLAGVVFNVFLMAAGF